MIVIDIGCQPQEREESIVKLCKAYLPAILYGFDPHPALEPGLDYFRHGRTQRRTVIVRSRMAAWTSGGFVSYREDGIRSGVVPFGHSTRVVPCFDLAAWLKTLPMPETEVVLKMDAEGAEYPLLSAIRDQGLDLLLKEALIEYHPEETANGHWRSDPPSLRCPVQDWDRDW